MMKQGHMNAFNGCIQEHMCFECMTHVDMHWSCEEYTQHACTPMLMFMCIIHMNMKST